MVLVSDDDDDDEKEEKADARRSPPEPTCKRSVWSVGAGAVVDAPPLTVCCLVWFRYGRLLTRQVEPFRSAPTAAFPWSPRNRNHSEGVLPTGGIRSPLFSWMPIFAGIILIFFVAIIAFSSSVQIRFRTFPFFRLYSPHFRLPRRSTPVNPDHRNGSPDMDRPSLSSTFHMVTATCARDKRAHTGVCCVPQRTPLVSHARAFFLLSFPFFLGFQCSKGLGIDGTQSTRREGYFHCRPVTSNLNNFKLIEYRCLSPKLRIPFRVGGFFSPEPFCGDSVVQKIIPPQYFTCIFLDSVPKLMVYLHCYFFRGK